ncbi:hypothetical protein T484DRAFT_1761084 [Baffinella frigidus]|nr:hypothetical protein T484DRAFT_1761084 [Cryptophyta sp. CCMP2293]
MTASPPVAAKWTNRQVLAVFRDSATKDIIIQMPYYHNGTVNKWKTEMVRGVLYDVVVAIGFLHSSGIIHADIKPVNILVDFDNRGILSDFDISVDSVTRTGIT